jgi:putative FmdB family regulatory protein
VDLLEEPIVPTYAYTCTECGHSFDAVQSFSDAPLTECPQCSGRLRKRFSPVGVVFKGSGFYRTDSRKPEKSETSEKSDAGQKSADKSEKKSDKAPATAGSSSSSTAGSTSSGGSSKPKAD